MFNTQHSKMIPASIIIVAFVCAALTYQYNIFLSCFEAAFTAVASLVLLIIGRAEKKHKRKYMLKVSKKLDFSKRRVLSDLPFPVVVCDKDGNINWVNDKFLNHVTENIKTVDNKIDAYFNGKDLFEIVNSNETAIFYNNHSYTVFSDSFEYEDGENYILFFVDNTALRNVEKKFKSSRPYVIFIEADNIGYSRFDFRDSEKAEIRSILENEIEKWTGNYSCITKRLSENRYIIISEKSDVEKMIETKFSILDSVRSLKYKNLNLNATLSLGVSGGDNLSDCEKRAQKALEMALGRGGDQAVVAVNDSYEFYGGVSKTVEKKAKVKARVIGSALSEMIEASSEVIVMGHKNPDLDAIGSALGICCACEAVGIPAFIVTDKNKTLCSALIDRILNDENQSICLIDETTALNIMNKKTLLIVVDTHVKGYVEFHSVYEAASTVFVIDHHRKSVDYIDNAVVFHHDSGASSTCEMVTELLQYIKPEPLISELTAEALLSGIMLDTKNFILQSGVRTFEAAAFLKKNNADTVNVQKLFANSIDNYRLKNKIVSESVQYKECAISIADIDSRDIRIISSQAADELLNIEGIKASFVIYKCNDLICISARSYGERNVQIVMESLGGGGHRTMAAAQLSNISPEKAKTMILYKIDEFYDTKEK